MDTSGPEVRTGPLKPHLEDTGVNIVAGATLKMVSDADYLGDEKCIGCNYPELPTHATEGKRILVADGDLELTVISVHPQGTVDFRIPFIVVRAENACQLGSKKNVHIQGSNMMVDGITEKDRFDLQHFATKYDVDIISGSLINSAKNIQALRSFCPPRTRIHAKIETLEAVKNIDEILEAADGIHVSRGDLGMDLDLEKVSIAQKMIIRKTVAAGKPVVISTQMLNSMIVCVNPTHAECSDVANAVLDGTDAVMLSGETASGQHPVEVVRIMKRIVTEASRAIEHGQRDNVHQWLLPAKMPVNPFNSSPRTSAAIIAASTVQTSENVNAALIIIDECAEGDGTLTLQVARCRPQAVICAICSLDKTAAQLEGLSYGVVAVVVSPGELPLTPSTVESAFPKIFCRKECAVGKQGTIVCLFKLTEGPVKYVQRVITLNWEGGVGLFDGNDSTHPREFGRRTSAASGGGLSPRRPRSISGSWR
jgi:pyruvate kinase